MRMVVLSSADTPRAVQIGRFITTALLLLYCCSTAALLLLHYCLVLASAGALLLIYNCFTTALLLPSRGVGQTQLSASGGGDWQTERLTETHQCLVQLK
jgi:hypothetical protein